VVVSDCGLYGVAEKARVVGRKGDFDRDRTLGTGVAPVQAGNCAAVFDPDRGVSIHWEGSP